MKISQYPIRFLLYLEWILLGIIATSEALRFPLSGSPKMHFWREASGIPYFNLIALAAFGAMGLILPKNKQPIYKIVYTALEIALILFMSSGRSFRLFPLLCVILVIRNCFIFEGKPGLIVTGFAFVLFVLKQLERLNRWNMIPHVMQERLVFMFLSSALLFGLVLVFLQLLVSAVISEHNSRKKLAIAHEKLRQYALRIEDIATLQERNRISREIHDSLGHYLTALNLHLEAAWKLRESNPAEAMEFLADAKKLGSKSLEAVRQSVATLRSDPLQNLSLKEAIATLIEDFHKSSNLLPNTSINLYFPLPNDIKTAIYRIVQEALTNIAKYSKATEVKITISAETDLQLTIEDNGKGFNLDQNTTGFGLQGMRERALALGGKFKIVSAPENGCKIIAKFPL